MAILRVDVDRISRNPFQYRVESGDIASLERAIAAMVGVLPETAGLMDVPLARVVLDGAVVPVEPGLAALHAALANPEAEVQLAAGHRRRMAFKGLSVRGDADGEGRERWQEMPLDIRALTDEAMADIAWRENHDRLEVSPPDKAEAIRAALDRFGWTQAHLAERWGLSTAQVSNLLRLLVLPVEILSLMRQGAISERHGRALLPVLQVDEHLETLLGFLGGDGDDVFASVRVVEARARDFLMRSTSPINWSFPEDFAPAEGEVEGGRAGRCSDCPVLVRVGRESRCGDQACERARRNHYEFVISGPSEAARHYQMRGVWADVSGASITSWASCAGCGRFPGNFPEDALWLRSSSTAHICPECRERAGLVATEVPVVAVAEDAVAEAGDGWRVHVEDVCPECCERAGLVATVGDVDAELAALAAGDGWRVHVEDGRRSLRRESSSRWAPDLSPRPAGSPSDAVGVLMRVEVSRRRDGRWHVETRGEGRRAGSRDAADCAGDRVEAIVSAAVRRLIEEVGDV